jgi:2'-phosphotransferase
VTQVVHGTYRESWINIKRTGLSKMGRTHIHFAKGEYGSADVISGTFYFHTAHTAYL